MKHMKLLLPSILLLCYLGQGATVKIINCYVATWATYRPGNGKFEPENIDANMCTHLSYSFFGISDKGKFRSLDSRLDIELGFIKRYMALKQINPKLKVLAAVGGWNEGSSNYSKMAEDPDKRKTFIQSSLEFMQQHAFDGLILDWEYPGKRGGLAKDKENLVHLLNELKETFTPLNLELSIAVGASANIADISYDIPKITKHVDFIHVMTYDFCRSTSAKLCFNSPLKGQGDNNVETSIKFWLNSGVPAAKLILGLDFYGDSFQLSNPQQTTPGSPCSGPGAPGPFTSENGSLGYNEICTMLPGWTGVFDNAHSVPYMFKGNQWVNYDNVKSLELKLDFLNSVDLGGAMVWSIDTDDFLGECGEKFPLLKTINRKLNSTSVRLPNGASRKLNLTDKEEANDWIPSVVKNFCIRILDMARNISP